MHRMHRKSAASRPLLCPPLPSPSGKVCFSGVHTNTVPGGVAAKRSLV